MKQRHGEILLYDRSAYHLVVAHTCPSIQARGILRDADDALVSVSTQEQREKAIGVANELEDWLYDDGWEETAAVYRKKRAELAEVMYHRMCRPCNSIAVIQSLAPSRSCVRIFRT